MERIQKERDRLLAATARNMGALTTLTALLCLVLPQSFEHIWVQVAAIVALLVVFLGFVRLRVNTPMAWLACLDVLAIGTVVLVGAAEKEPTIAVVYGLAFVAGGSTASVGVLLGTTGPRMVLCALSFVASVAALVYAVSDANFREGRAEAVAVACWIFGMILAVWLGRVVPQTMRRIANMSEAYRAERVATETEARRRQGARLLHDTVLATLTLLAHSGVGVSENALREQAAQDAALLRQLRMGLTPNPAASGEYKLRPVEESTLGNTLESVKQRFRRMGLEVSWHGKGQVLLPSETLDAFLLALSESLENVRRHSGVGEAHVTITDDDTSVRAMVTDDGVGFSIESIAPGRLGFTESIVARLRDVGGNARLFSAPGSGTTVVLEVPK
ncbi:sensor histidine kinase [Gryllotalpicola ginsengisoli]|uniref:sensor histidine kinase n=1 Tax=Gryllotalpicola ginsengisoli TaxID=444608 RepID=UPI0003B7714C|nr:ATP-binding protein [Gryllotalpicola ginsengisoli]